jgi:alpha-L-rhamnosidase
LEESGPAYLLSRWVLGAEPAQPGWRRVRIQPQLGNLAWAHGSVPTPLGDIQLRWEKTPHLSGVITLPAGIEGEALIACGDRETAHALKPGVNALS